jgi:beta-glucosidase-like glycosyl hydrolase
MSVTKEDLREQNEKLAKVVRQLDEENSKLIDQARANLEKKTVEAARSLAKSAQTVKNKAETAQAAAKQAEAAAVALPYRSALLGLALVSTALFVALSGHVTEMQLLIGSWSLYLLFEVGMWFWKG